MSPYEPREDSFFMAEFLEKLDAPVELAVDVGTGSGVLAEVLAEKSKIVVASDISRDAIKEAKKKIKRGNVFFVLGSLVDFIRKCDVVVFNAPYLSREENESYDPTIHQKMEDGRDVLAEFIKSISNVDFKRAYLLFSSLSSLDEMNRTISSSGLKLKIVARKKLFFEELRIAEITK